MLLIPVVIAGLLAGLAGITLSFNQQVGTLHDDHGLAEQVLGALAGNSARVITLTGRPGASVRLIYDPVRRRGGLLVVRLADPGDDLTYRLWLIQRGVPHSVATFVPAADRETFVPILEDLTGYDAITIAVGPQNGPTMTATPVLHASLAASSQHLRVPRPTRPLKME
jgi:Anti-sigma-K factor rskA